MVLNPNIILAGQQPDIVNTLDRSNIAAARANQMQDQRQMNALYQQHGQGLVSGDRGAINALAAVDPAQALNFSQVHRGNRIQDEQIAMKMAEYKRGLSAKQAAAEAEQIKRGVFMASGAQTPEEWDSVVRQLGQDQLVGQFEQKDILLRQYMTAAEILEANKGPKPDYQIVDGQYVDRNNPQAGAQAVPGFVPRDTKDSAKEQEIARVMELGVDRATAIKIADGIYKVVTDPTTRDAVIVDMATQQPVAVIGMGPNQGKNNLTAGGQPALTADVSQEPERLSFGTRFEGAQDAFGAEGFIRGGINTAADTLGFGMPYPETSGAQRDFAVMREGLTNDIASAYDGRVPAFLLQNIQNLTPQAGSVFEGPGSAQDKLRALGRSLNLELQNIRELQGRKLSPGEAEVLAKRRQVIESSLGQVSQALKAFKPDVQLRPEVEDRMKAYQ